MVWHYLTPIRFIQYNTFLKHGVVK